MYYVITTTNKELALLALEKGAEVVKKDVPDKPSATNRDKGADKIRELLDSFLMKPNLKGYGYLRFVLKKCIGDSEYHHEGITSVVYPECAKNFNTTASRVERAIRHVIERSFENAPEQYEKVFGIREKPTNSEFISRMSLILN